MYPHNKRLGHLAGLSEDCALSPAPTGCPIGELRQKLRRVGLRPTLQRMSLGLLLFGRGDRHFSAEEIFNEAQASNVPISLATIYNCLHAFKNNGLIRLISVDNNQLIYDTNTSDHHHFVNDEDGTVIDIPALSIDRSSIAGIPEELEVVDVQVIMRVRPKSVKETVPWIPM